MEDDETRYTTIVEADQVTEEIIEIIWQITNGWYQDRTIDWENVWDRADGSELEDGTKLDFGEDLDSPAMRKIKNRIRKDRRNS